MWCIMRCDYSAILVQGGSTVAFLQKDYAETVAHRVCGHAVKWKVAKKILTINRMIGRRD